MQELVHALNKRKRVTIFIVVLFAILALLFNHNFTITTPNYFDGKYNIRIVNGLILYKMVELIIIYYYLFYRYIIRLRTISYTESQYPKLKKHTKLLFFLIPQGNTIFGIIAYKLSGDVLYFIVFSFIALITLILVNPNILLLNSNNRN